MPHILLLPGDGIGPEVTQQAKRVLEWFNAHDGADFTFSEAHLGGCATDAEGNPYPESTSKAAKAADAILLGAVGGPKWEQIERELRPERGLLAIRKDLGLFANLRPAMVFDALASASSLKEEIVSGLDIMIVRELTGGIYFGEPKGVEEGENGNWKAYNTLVYTRDEVRRIADVAFDLAKKRDGRVCSVDKANVLIATEMWREEVTKRHAEVAAELELSHMYVDNAAMQLVRNPKQFDVMVTTNMFGDILSDAAAMLTGSLGMLPSASLGAKQADGTQHALYEPVHGSAPDIAGQDKANPIATILSASMMLRYSFNDGVRADRIDNAIKTVLAENIRTKDIAEDNSTIVGTTAMGDAIIAAL